MKILFLDIDGVLNDHRKNPCNDYCGILPHCMAELNRVIEATGCEIVVSSSWRYLVHGRSMTMDGFRYLMLTHGLSSNRPILEITREDRNVSDKHERGKQIADWLHGKPDVSVYAVVDDDNEIGIPEAGHPFVQTNGKIGLTEADANKLIQLLNQEPTSAND
jgi:hypothetical protein